MMSAMLSPFQTLSWFALLEAPGDGTVTSVSPRRIVGLSQVEQIFTRCLFYIRLAIVPVDTEVNTDIASGLKGLSVYKRGQDVKTKKYINALLKICVESKKNQVQRGFTEAQRYRNQCAEGHAARPRDPAGIILTSEYKGVTCSVRTICLAQPGRKKSCRWPFAYIVSHRQASLLKP